MFLDPVQLSQTNVYGGEISLRSFVVHFAEADTKLLVFMAKPFKMIQHELMQVERIVCAQAAAGFQ